MAFVAGLVSVSFRKSSPREVVEMARANRLSAIEWGGDVHVPPGDFSTARDVKEMTSNAGLSVLAYGSYVRLGEEDAATFPRVVQTAAALGAPSIRVWAGRRGSAAADLAYRQRVIDQAREIARIAADAGIVLCYEYHIDTLTDTDASALSLLRATADEPAIRTLWQPPHERPVEENVAGLRGVLPWLHHVHVFHWPKRGERAPLADGAARWRAYLDVLRADARRDWPLLLEFVRNDDEQQLRADAATLREWIAQ